MVPIRKSIRRLDGTESRKRPVWNRGGLKFHAGPFGIFQFSGRSIRDTLPERMIQQGRIA